MLEYLTTLVVEYGLAGLFISSALGSTIFIPFTIELVFPLLVKTGLSANSIILVAAAGSTLGAWVNYILGYYGSHIIQKRVKKQELDKAKKLMDKYGWFGLFLIITLPLPLPVDPITILCGITHMNALEFTATVLAGKIIKYAASLGLLVGLLSLIL